MQVLGRRSFNRPDLSARGTVTHTLGMCQRTCQRSSKAESVIHLYNQISAYFIHKGTTCVTQLYYKLMYGDLRGLSWLMVQAYQGPPYFVGHTFNIFGGLSSH